MPAAQFFFFRSRLPSEMRACLPASYCKLLYSVLLSLANRSYDNDLVYFSLMSLAGMESPREGAS